MSPDLIAALSTGHKIGLATVAGLFIVFALVSSMLIPRYRPDFPSQRGYGVFLLVSALFFVGTMSAVWVFGKEPAEAEAGGEAAPTGETQENAPATTSTGKAPTATITAKETEFKITLDKQPTAAGKYEFVADNTGKIEHDLVVEGPGVAEAKTPLIKPGAQAKLRVTLEKGKYTLYCSVPGHEAAGMKHELTVG